MDPLFFVQGASWQHHVFSKHGPTGHFHGDLGSRARITTLIAAAFAAVLFLLVRRLTTGIPFFQPKNYRSFTVYNKDDFLHLYDEDEAPSQAPIEPLEGVVSISVSPKQFGGLIWLRRISSRVGVGTIAVFGGARNRGRHRAHHEGCRRTGFCRRRLVFSCPLYSDIHSDIKVYLQSSNWAIGFYCCQYSRSVSTPPRIDPRCPSWWHCGV